MRRLVAIAAMAAALLTACGGDEPSSDGRLTVVASFYPIAYAAERVGGDAVTVRNLTPAGVEPHDLELTADDVDVLDGADAVFYVGGDFQPAIERVVERRDGGGVDVADGLRLGADAHFWLDPTLMVQATERIEAALAEADPANASAYARNAATFTQELEALDEAFSATLSACRRHEIVTAHAAFDYLASRYGLEQHAISGIEPGAEPEPERLAELADLIGDRGVTTVFYEELVPRDFAETLAREAKVRTAVLDPLEGLTGEAESAGDTYVSVMRRNLAALATALDCPPPPPAP